MTDAKEAPAVRSAADLLNARPLRIIPHFIEYFGKTVHFRELTGAGIDLFLSIELSKDGKTAKVNREYLIGSLQQTICNPEGELLFAGPEGRQQLEGLAWEGLQELFNGSGKALGNTTEKIAEKKAA